MNSHLPTAPNPVVATDICCHCGGAISRRSWGDWLHDASSSTGCPSNTAAKPRGATS